MVRSNVSILGKILLILLTIIFTIAALAGAIVVIYKTVRVRDIGNLFSENLINQEYDGTIEDVVQTIAGKVSDGTLSLQDLVDISPALGSALDALVDNVENVGLFRVNKTALYGTPVQSLTSSLSSLLVITGTLNDLSQTLGFALPDLPVIAGGGETPVELYTRANEDGSGKIDDAFAYSSLNYEYFTRTTSFSNTFLETVDTGETDGDGNPITEERESHVVQWTKRALYSLKGVTLRGTDLYWNGNLLYLRTARYAEDGTTVEGYGYSRLTSANDAVYALNEQTSGETGTPDAGGEGGAEQEPETLYNATFALEQNETLVILTGLNEEDEDYTVVDEVTATGEVASVPEVAARYKYTPLYAQLDEAPGEGVKFTEWNGKYYVCVNTADPETGRYALDSDNGGFLIAAPYRDGRELYYLDYETSEAMTLEQAQSAAAQNTAVYVKTDGLANLPLVYALDTLSSVLDTDTMTLVQMGDYFGVDFTSDNILEDLLYVPFSYLSDSMTTALNSVYLDDVLELDADSSKVMLFLAYGEEGVDYEIRETSDPETGETTRQLVVYRRKTVGSVTTATDSMKIGDIVSVDGSSSPLLQAVQDWTINDFSNTDKVDSLTLGQVLSIGADSPNILQQLADVSLGDIGAAIDTLTVEDILGSDALAGDPLLELLRSSSLQTLADDIKSLTLQELFADEVYEYHLVASVSPAEDSNNDAILALLQEAHAEALGKGYGGEMLYVRSGSAYRLYSDFLDEYNAASGGYTGTMPTALYSPYLLVEGAQADDYSGVPLYYRAETTEGEGETAETTYSMQLATEVLGWKLPETLPDGVTADTVFGVRVYADDGSFTYRVVNRDETSDDYDAGKGLYLVGTLYYRDAASQAVKALSLAPAAYGLRSDLPDGAALFARRVYAADYGSAQSAGAAQLYESNGMYWFDLSAQTYRLLPLTAVYVDASLASAENAVYYYYGESGSLYAVGQTDGQTGLPDAVTGVDVTLAYFDADGNLYVYRANPDADGAEQLYSFRDGSFVDASAAEVSARYAVDLSRGEALPENGAGLYRYGDVTGLWKYLLLDENGVEENYTLQSVGSLIGNMSKNISRATLRDLVQDGMLTINPPEDMSVSDVLGYTVPSVIGGEFAGRELGSLTINELINLMISVLTHDIWGSLSGTGAAVFSFAA